MLARRTAVPSCQPVVRSVCPSRCVRRVVRTAAGTSTSSIVDAGAEGFDTLLKDAGDRLVVVDFFTDWCGPCKLFAPKFEKLAEEYTPKGVIFVKFNSSAGENAKLAMKLAIKQLPTFHLYLSSTKQAEVVGPKEADLRGLIEKLGLASTEQAS